jgi:hypothetical protein
VMTDIVERLRSPEVFLTDGVTGSPVANAAAVEIVRLRRERDEARARVNHLQSILDRRPAINAGLPETYIAWSHSVYRDDFDQAAKSA